MMPRAQSTKKTAAPDPIGRAAETIAEFCRSRGFSQAMYFKMKAAGEGPDEMMIGRRRVISAEAATAWRKAREKAAKAASNSKNEGKEIAA
jgi:hypothetical protein